MNTEPRYEQGLALLGTTLSSSLDDVMSEFQRRTQASKCTLAPEIEALFAAAAESSTGAFAEWLTSGDPEGAHREGLGAARVFGLLAACNDAPLNEITKRCMIWHDALERQLRATAGDLGVEHSLEQALSMLRRSLNVTLVRMTEAFELERQSVHDALVAHQAELIFRANHDGLTGLLNRGPIIDRIDQLLGRHGRFGTEAAVMFIDLDNFKTINDNFGHDVGDDLLRAAAERFGHVLGKSDVLGRLGGDEFIVVTEDAPDVISGRLLDAMRQPFVLGDPGSAPITITSSIGVAVGTQGSATEMLRNADIAMYRAKSEGRDRCVFFEPEMFATVATWFKLDAELKHAVEHEEFVLAYQPVFDLATMSISGVEALLRWRHPTRGMIAPDDFIAHLEETDLITRVGRWVLDEATARGGEWHRRGQRLEISVNLSARQLDDDAIVDDIRHALERSGLDPHALCVEVTETAIMRDVESATRRLQAIRSLGARIAIDDFGTGYSSLAHLQKLPADVLKIDRSFIGRLSLERSAEMLVHAQIQLAKALQIETLAEGVEEPYQLAFLNQEQCTSAQGFLLCRPIDAWAVEGFIHQWDDWAQHGSVPLRLLKHGGDAVSA
jgi:diguanylate cyclase (GGDEF)-like protein